MTFNNLISEISASIIDFYKKMEKTGKSKLDFEDTLLMNRLKPY